MNILLIGGSGIISTEVCKLAITKGYDVFILNRGKRKQFIHPQAKLIIADMRLDSVDVLKSKIDDMFFDVVVDFISFTVDELMKSMDVFEKKYKQYIFISSATVYETQKKGIKITEETRLYNPIWNYADEKIACEKYLIERSIQNSNSYYTIIRPYVTYGVTRIPFGVIPDNANYTLINRIKLHKPVVLWDGGETLCTLTYSADFAVGVVGLFLNKKAENQAFHITSPIQHRWKDVFNVLCDILQIDGVSIDIPTEYIVKAMPKYKKSLMGDKSRNMIFDNSKICDAVPEFTENTSLQEGIKNVVDYYNSNPNNRVIDYKWEGQIDRMIASYSKNKINAVFDKKMLSLRGYEGKLTIKNVIEYCVCRNKFLFKVAQLLIK